MSDGFVLAVIQEPWFRPGIMSAAIPRARAPVGLDAAWLHGFVLAVIQEPWFRPGIMSASIPRARAPVGRDAVWLLGFVKPKLRVLQFVIIVIREPLT